MSTGRELLGGVVVPLVTALDRRGEPDPDAAAPLLRHLHAGGVRRLLLLGSNGEGPAVAPEAAAEYAAAVTTAWRGLAGHEARVLAVAAGAGTREAAHRAELLATATPDAVVAMPPTYFHHPAGDLVAHFRALAGTGPPLVLYDIPAYSGNPLPPRVLTRLVEDGLVVGAKLSSTDPDLLTTAAELAHAHPRFAFASGVEGHLVDALDQGAAGIVPGLALLAPGTCQQLVTAHAAGDLDRARELHARLLQLRRIHTIRPHGSGVVATKTALHLLGLSPPHATPPFQPFTPEETAQLRGVLDDLADLLPPLPRRHHHLPGPPHPERTQGHELITSEATATEDG